MQTESYRTKARLVRQSARAHLVELRKARMALRDGVNGGLNNLPSELGPDQAEMHATAGESAAPDVVNGDALEDMVMRNAAGRGDAPVDSAPGSELAAGEEPQEPSLPEAEPSTEAAADVPSGQPEPDGGGWQDSDLSQLPGAGPGLVWMLNQCGVATLKDLAGQDPDALANKLGVVGQILDVAHWVRLAGENSADQP